MISESRSTGNNRFQSHCVIVASGGGGLCVCVCAGGGVPAGYSLHSDDWDDLVFFFGGGGVVQAESIKK